jgi:hypothetical protein
MIQVEASAAGTLAPPPPNKSWWGL